MTNDSGSCSRQNGSETKSSGEHDGWAASNSEFFQSTSRVSYAFLGVALVGGIAALLGYASVVVEVAVKLILPLWLLTLGVQHMRRWDRTADGIRGMVARQWAHYGNGFYGLVSLFTFLYLEAQMLEAEVRAGWDTWQGAPSPAETHAFLDFAGDQLWSIAMASLLHVSAESIVNAVWAGLWPFKWITHFGLWPAVLLAGVAYGAYALAVRFIPAFRHVEDEVQTIHEHYEQDPWSGMYHQSEAADGTSEASSSDKS